MRQYIVKVDSSSESHTDIDYVTCNFFTYVVACVYRFFKGWSKPRIIGSYVSKSIRD